MDVADDTTRVWADKIDKEHRARARTLSEFAAKLIMKRKGQLPRNFDEWCQDMDIIKRAHEHVGACNAMNEIKTALFPSPEVPPAAAPTSGTVGHVPPPAPDPQPPEPAPPVAAAPPPPPAPPAAARPSEPHPPGTSVAPPAAPPPPVLPTPKKDEGSQEQRG